MTAPLEEGTAKHLEFIQNVITRMSNSSFLIRGWSLTLSSALLAFSVKDVNPKIACIALIPLGAFWLLDCYYLRQERAYRMLYDEVRVANSPVEPFSMSTRPYHSRVPWKEVIASKTVLLFYGGITTTTAIIAVLL